MFNGAKGGRGPIVSSTPVAAAVTALLPIAGAFFVVLFSAADARAEGLSGTCEDAAEVAVLPSPLAPWKGAPLRVIFAAEKPLEGELSLIAPDGSVAAKSRDRQGGPPYFWFAEVASPAAGTWHAHARARRAPAGCGTITRDIAVRDDKPPPPRATPGSVWPVRNTWNRATENLYSAWIEKLFDAPLDAEPSWPALHEVLRDRSRNILFNYLGLGEDEVGDGPSPRLRRPGVLFARLFRVQDGTAVRLLEVLARRRRQAAEMLEWTSILNAAAATPANRARTARRPSESGGNAGQSEAEAARGIQKPRAEAVGLAASFGNYLRVVGDAVQSGAVRTCWRTTTTPISIPCR